MPETGPTLRSTGPTYRGLVGSIVSLGNNQNHARQPRQLQETLRAADAHRLAAHIHAQADRCAMLNHRIDAYELLRKLGASSHLICHLQLVGEAADELLQGYAELGVKIDSVLVELGAALHDAGKITHPSEIYGPGSLHELAGERLLLAQSVQPSVARCCVTHASWEKGELSLEERTVALADNLWKGKREPELELLIINQIASKLGHSMWDIFLHLDTLFERIATHGDIRLQRSRESSIREKH